MRRFLLRNCFLAVIMFTSSMVWAQDRTISGTVTSTDDGSPLPGVNVVVKGTTIGSVTSADGDFTIAVPSTATTLVFTFIGLETQEVEIGTSSTVDIQMATDVTQLTEVVVVGYGEQSSRLKTQAVSTVTSEAFRNMPAIGPQQLLQGQAAGVQIVNSSGVLGGAASVRIRGAASISGGGSPLYVIDGIPLNDGANGAFSTQQGGAAPLNPLIDLNPNDIESISVLKDAAAISIYGSRGANGVILIKTKRGAADGKTKVNFDYSTGWSEPTKVLSYMQPEQYKTFVNEYRVARGQAPTAFPAGGFDWVEGVVQTGRVNNYNLSAIGGNEKTKFYVGAGIQDESGFTIGNELQRISGRFNLDHKISNKITFNVNYALSNTVSDRIGVENNTYAPLTSAYLQTPTVEPRDAEGNFVNTGFIANVLAIEALNTNEFKFMRQTGSIGGEWNIVENLRFRSELGIDLVQSELHERSVEVIDAGGYGSRSIIQDHKWLTTNTLNYDKAFGTDHNFTAMLGQSFETSVYDDIFVEGIGFVSDVLKHVNSAAEKTSTDATSEAWSLESFFGRLNYRFKDRYILEATARRDGSSKFGPNRKYGNFWAASAGWIISDESFLSNVSLIDHLKLTASYGVSGNDRIGNYKFYQLYAAGLAADYDGSPGLIPTQIPNPDLSWEETAQLDIGLSAAILKSRLSIDVNYYVKNTTGLLLNVPVPFTTGFPSRVANVGEMKNSGWDIQLRSTNISRGDFVWTTNFNVGFLKNEVTSLPENRDPVDGRNFISGSTAQRAIQGESVNTFFMIRYKGINPQTGDAEWLNIDGEPTTAPLGSDRVVVGSAIPDFTGGITNTFRYKGFDLMAFFNFSYGNKVLIDGLRFTENLGGTFNKSTDLLNYWKQPGDNAFAPALTSTTAAASNFSRLSTLQLLDGSYMRLKTLSLGYNAPRAFLQKTKAIASLRIYIQTQNILTIMDKDFRGPDPEVSANGQSNQVLGESFFALPQAKSVMLGVNVGF